MIDLFLEHWILYSLGIYILIAFIILIVSKDIAKSSFWGVYILGDIIEVFFDFLD